MLDLLGIKVLLWITLSSMGETLQMSIFFYEDIKGFLKFIEDLDRKNSGDFGL
jgi:hypothetical protein